MNNRWSDAARAASIAVRQGHKLLAGRPVQKQGRKATLRPIVKAPAATGNPALPKPNIFWSSTHPFAGRQQGGVGRGIIRYDPKYPDMAADLGYNMGPDYERRRKRQGLPLRTRVVIGGKRYTRVGGRLVPDLNPGHGA